MVKFSIYLNRRVFVMAKNATFLHAVNEDSDQTARMCWLNWGFVGLTSKDMFAHVATYISTFYRRRVAIHVDFKSGVGLKTFF